MNSPVQTLLGSVSFFNNIGISVGWNGTIIKSSDSGSSWTLQNSNTIEFLNDCDMVSVDIGFAVGFSGSILKTTNGGNDWVIKNSGTSQNLSSIKMQNELTGVSVGENIILKTTDGGNTWFQKQVVTNVVSKKNNDVNNFELFQNYPNPFNPTTKIKYKLPEINFVTIKVYDILGNEITTLVNDEKPADNYEVEFSATGGGINLTSGIYLYQIKAGNYSETKKMILLK